MISIIDTMDALRINSKDLAESLAKHHDLPSDQMPIAALNMVHQNIVMSMELLSFYSGVFPPVKRGRFEDHLDDHPDESQRVIHLLNQCFVSCMSNFESCARKALNYLPGTYGNGSKKTFYNIAERCRSIGWIDREDEIAWKHLIEIRNSIVHNNGESPKNEVFDLPNGVRWRRHKGFTTTVSLRHIPRTLDWAIEAFARWIDSYLRNCGLCDYTPRFKSFCVYRLSLPRHIPTYCDWNAHNAETDYAYFIFP